MLKTLVLKGAATGGAVLVLVPSEDTRVGTNTHGTSTQFFSQIEYYADVTYDTKGRRFSLST